MAEITFFEFTRPGRTLAPDLRHLAATGLGPDGTVYVSGACHPAGEAGAFLCAGYDRATATVAEYRGHLYYPIDWIRAEVRSELTRAAGKLKQALRQTLESLDRMESETRRPDKPEEQRA